MQEILITVDGKQLQFAVHESGGEYEIDDSFISDIRILACMRDLAAKSLLLGDRDEGIMLTVVLGDKRLPWEDDIPWAFFDFNYSVNDRFIATFPLNTSLASQHDAISELIEPLLANTPFTLSEILHGDDIPSYGGWHTWEIQISCTSESVTFKDILNMRRLMSQAVFLPSKMITTPYLARLVLQLGQAERLIGHRESEWLEAKSAPYEFKNIGDQAWKLELAKDVAQFANSHSGGLLVIGFHTKRRDGVDTIDKVTAFPHDEKRAQTYRDILKSRIHPPVVALEIEAIRDGDLCILYAYIPVQPEENKPYLVTGATLDGEFESLGITIPRRHGDASISMSAQELHSIIVAGRAFLRGHWRKTD